MTPPLLTLLIITGGRDPLPALESSIASNRREDIEWLVVVNDERAHERPDDIQGVPVRWLSSKPGDGHAAFNRGVAAALGELVLPLFAGDELHPGSISRLINEWHGIPTHRSARHSGVTGIAATSAASGALSASVPFPFESNDALPDQLRYAHGWTGEPVYAMRVELLRARPIPSPGGPFPPLAMIWRVAGRGFLTRAINAELAIRDLPTEPSVRGERLDALSALTHELDWFRQNPRALIEAARTFHLTSDQLNVSKRRQLRALNSSGARALWAVTLPLAMRRQKSPTSPPVETPSRPAVAPARAGRTPSLVLLTRSLYLSGAERQLVTLAIGLHRRKINVRVVVFYGGTLERDLREAGVPVTILEKRGRWDIFSFLRNLARALREAKPDVVHGYLPMPNLFALLLRPLHRGRVVWGIRASNIDLSRYDWGAKLETRAEQKLARFVPLLIANSQAGRDYAVATGYPAKRIIVIPNGIDTKAFRRDEEGRTRLRAAWRIPAQAPLIGRVGRLDPQKDYPTFLRAAAIVAKSRPDARFACIGGGLNHRTEELHRLGHELGLDERLIWTGPVTIMASAYSALDICVSSSAYGEGVPNVVAEAMACGTPVIATDVGDSAWTIGDDRYIVPPENPEALAELMLRMLDDIEAGFVDGATLRARVERELSVERLLDRTERALFSSGERPDVS